VLAGSEPNGEARNQFRIAYAALEVALNSMRKQKGKRV
jgi:hypothetical protein